MPAAVRLVILVLAGIGGGLILSPVVFSILQLGSAILWPFLVLSLAVLAWTGARLVRVALEWQNRPPRHPYHGQEGRSWLDEDP